MKKYSIIYADPPWAYRTYSKKGQGRSAESHYPTMSIEDIKALPVGELADKDWHSRSACCRCQLMHCNVFFYRSGCDRILLPMWLDIPHGSAILTVRS